MRHGNLVQCLEVAFSTYRLGQFASGGAIAEHVGEDFVALTLKVSHVNGGGSGRMAKGRVRQFSSLGALVVS